MAESTDKKPSALLGNLLGRFEQRQAERQQKAQTDEALEQAGITDEGAGAVAVGNQDGVVIMKFDQPREWIGMEGADAAAIGIALLEHARAVGAVQDFKVTLTPDAAAGPSAAPQGDPHG